MLIYNELPEIAKRTFASNELAFACLTNIPITPGHSLVIPKREVATLAELTPDELLAIQASTRMSLESFSIGPVVEV